MYNVIEIKNLEKKFGDKQIFNNLNLNFRKNGKYAIMAPSGYGKSTLLKIIAGLIYPDSGQINIFGKLLNNKNISTIRNKVCMLPQLTSSFSNLKVNDLILKPFSFEINRGNIPDEKSINELIHKTGLDKEITEKKFGKLSGGEKQRILIIICKLLKKDILLLDEPTSALDKASSNIISEILFDDKTTIIAASHDKEFSDNFDNIIDLKELMK